MAYDTAASIISDAAVECGLAAVADPYASTDANVAQLCVLLKGLGRSLVRAHGWQQLRRRYSLLTLAGQSRYALPTDFGRMLDASGWNRSSRFPLAGPLSGQQWQAVEGVAPGLTTRLLFRVEADALVLSPDAGATAGQVVAYEYTSSFWVLPAALGTVAAWRAATAYFANQTAAHGGNVYLYSQDGTSAAYGPTALEGDGDVEDGTAVLSWQSTAGTTAPTLATDVLLFDSNLLVKGLRLAFLRAKGYATEAAQGDFLEALEAAKNDAPAPTLSLGGGVAAQPLLSLGNLPVTGYGG